MLYACESYLPVQNANGPCIVLPPPLVLLRTGQLVWSTSSAAHEVSLLLVNSQFISPRCTGLVCNCACKLKMSMACNKKDPNASQVEASDVIC